jgi:hypothetical protein
MSKTNTKNSAKTTQSNDSKNKLAKTAPAKSSKIETIDCSEFNITKFSFSEVDTSDPKPGDKKPVNKTQYVCFPRYNYGSKEKENSQQFYFKTKPIKMVQYGIPKLNPDYCKDDSKRGFFKIPYDPEQPACVELFTMFEKIDAFMAKSKDKLFANEKLKKFAAKYKYSSIVKTPEINPDAPTTGKDGKEFKPRMKYAKVKLATEYPNGELATTVFIRENGIPTPLEGVSTITELLEYFNWNSTDQFVISCNKIWLNKSGDEDGIRKYGVGFKCPQLEIIERQAANAKQTFEKYAFGGVEESGNVDKDAEEETNAEEEDTKPTKKTSKKPTKEENEDEDAEEAEEETKDTKPTKKTSKKPVDEDEENAAEEDAEDEDAEEDEEDAKPKKEAAKKPAAKPTKPDAKAGKKKN